MSKVKVENYSKEQTEKMVSDYTACGVELTEEAHEARAQVVANLVLELGKKDRSIRAKLVREGVYIKRDAPSKVTGEKPEKKEAMAEALVAAFGERVINGKKVKLSADSLAKANKTDLAILVNYFSSVDENVKDFPEVTA